jgi:tRNA(fMet)-specific endonuclease VapC
MRGCTRPWIFFMTIRILDFDEIANSHYEALRQQHIRIGIRDLHIAATVLAVGGILITRNARDFGLIPGLSIEDWSLP